MILLTEWIHIFEGWGIIFLILPFYSIIVKSNSIEQNDESRESKFNESHQNDMLNWFLGKIYLAFDFVVWNVLSWDIQNFVHYGKLISYLLLYIHFNPWNELHFRFVKQFKSCRTLFNSSAKCYANDLSETWYSGANDIIVVKQSDGSLKSTLLQLRVGKLTNFWTASKSREGKQGRLFVNGKEVLLHVNIEFILGKSGELMIYDKESKNFSCMLILSDTFEK